MMAYADAQACYVRSSTAWAVLPIVCKTTAGARKLQTDRAARQAINDSDRS